MFRSAIFILSALVGMPALYAADWSHWRGPVGNGVAPDATPPTEWSDTQNVKWKLKIPGRGSGSPVVWQDKVFVVTAVPAASGAEQTSAGNSRGRRGPAPLEELEFRLLCIDRGAGELLWERTAVSATPHEGTHSTNGFASASPTTDGERVYAHFGSRGLYCYTLAGELVWHRDFGDMSTRATFGEGSSPTIVDDMIIVPWDHEGPSAIYALNKRTGETIWKTERDEPTCWATPLVVEHAGRQQIVMNGQNYARAYDVKSGKELWKCGGQTDRPAASAVAAGGLVFVGSGFRGSYLGAFRPGGNGDIGGTANVAWSVNRDTPDIASPLLSEGRLYFFKGKAGILTCLDAATGKPYYSATRVGALGDMVYASPVAAGGFVFLTGRNGTTVVIKDSEQFEVVATNSVGEGVDATPALVDDEIFIRGEQHLFCIAK